jgi:hypothetical protein
MAQVLSQQRSKEKKKATVMLRHEKPKKQKRQADPLDEELGGEEIYGRRDYDGPRGAEGVFSQTPPLVRQSDPLRNKIRESIPEKNLKKAMLWFLLAEVDAEFGRTPNRFDFSAPSHYMRIQVNYRYPTAATPASLPHRRYPIAATPASLPHRRYPTAATPTPLPRRES